MIFYSCLIQKCVCENSKVIKEENKQFRKILEAHRWFEKNWKEKGVVATAPFILNVANSFKFFLRKWI